MGVNLGRAHLLVPQQLLNGAHVATVFQHVGGKRVPQGMAVGALRNAGLGRGAIRFCYTANIILDAKS
jgi:hypothetical protein